MKTNKVIIGCDHAGYSLKLQVIEHLKEKGVEYVDVGTNSAASCHYPEFAHAVCTKVQNGEAPVGILVCGTGVGMSMAANKHRGIRAACCSDTFSARLTREHNDANVLCFGERVIGPELAKTILGSYIELEFKDGPSTPKVAEIIEIDEVNMK